MNELIKEQLKDLKNVSFYTEDKKEILLEELDNYNTFIVEKNENKQEQEYLFIFDKYLIQPFSTFDFHEKFNKGKIIPLTIMEGKIIREVGKMYYIKVHGYYCQSNYCVHCLKEGFYNPVCNDCFKKLNVNEIEQITWEGFVPIKSVQIKTI